MRQRSGSVIQGTDYRGGQKENEGVEEEGSIPQSENIKTESKDDLDKKYPPRQGDATQQLLVDTYGGWLSIEALGEESENDAQYTFDYIDSDETVLSTSLRLKYSNLSGIAHEWWHSLEHALSFYNTGKSAK